MKNKKKKKKINKKKKKKKKIHKTRTAISQGVFIKLLF